MNVGVAGAATVDADGGADADVARYDGTDGADMIGIAANGAEATVFTDATARFDVLGVESLVVRGLGGADTITGVGNLAPLTTLTLEGGDDGDTLRGGNGADELVGGKGDDFVDGNQGADKASLGAGDDRFEWDPGDGSDVVEGQGGLDTLDFFGSAGSESIEASANAGRTRLTRNLGNIVMDVDGIEQLLVHALGGIDSLRVGDLGGTGVATVDVDLALGGGGDDGQPDSVVVSGRDRRDRVDVTRAGGRVLVAGLPAETRISGSEPAGDKLLVETLGGNDDVTVASDVADLIATTVDLDADE
jgi:hypothetical protein